MSPIALSEENYAAAEVVCSAQRRGLFLGVLVQCCQTYVGLTTWGPEGMAGIFQVN